ncbi:MAG: hypothetical protein KKA19_01050, partial [Candidatus Margulisbacteria bacterium]|nr:hypothetical protein [Candidatus Margulisiibacteriota bacterium]
RNAAKYISASHEYILFYAKNIDEISRHNINWKVKKSGLDQIYKQYNILMLTHVVFSFLNSFLRPNAILKIFSKWSKKQNMYISNFGNMHISDNFQNNILAFGGFNFPHQENIGLIFTLGFCREKNLLTIGCAGMNSLMDRKAFVCFQNLFNLNLLEMLENQAASRGIVKNEILDENLVKTYL